MKNKLHALLALAQAGLAALAFVAATPARADVSEASLCDVPQEIKFVRAMGWLGWTTARYTRYAGETSLTPHYKNLQMHNPIGPSHLMASCARADGKTLKRVTFKLMTSNFFGTDLGDHIAVGLRGRWYGENQDALANYEGFRYLARGVILRREPWDTQTAGISAELFDNYRSWPGGQVQIYSPTETMYDGIEYTIDIDTTAIDVTYTMSGGFVIGPSVPPVVTWTEPNGASALTGTGFGVVVLCGNGVMSQGNCEVKYPLPADPSFTVRLYDINAIWN